MKKTLIAAGIAAVMAAPVAMADVSVSGQVKYTLVDSDGGNDFAPSFDNSLTFKASEDLGNGLSAFAQITLDTDDLNNASNMGKDQKLGLKGSFGTLVAGRMETLTEGAVSSMMDDGLSSHGNNANLESSYTNIGRVNAVAYVSPTVNGFHAAIAGTNAADEDRFANNDIALVYENGPFTLKAARLDLRDTREVITIGASYSMGDAKVSVMTVENDPDAGSSVRDNMFRLDYKMGNNSLIVGFKDTDKDSADGDVTSVKLTHSFSKRTAAYIGHRNKDEDADVNYIGMIHKF
jgi:predicted porin